MTAAPDAHKQQPVARLPRCAICGTHDCATLDWQRLPWLCDACRSRSAGLRPEMMP